MIARFVLFWVITTGLCFAYAWIMTNQDKQLFKLWSKRISISALIAFLLLICIVILERHS
jgi:hypothetical protein